MKNKFPILITAALAAVALLLFAAPPDAKAQSAVSPSFLNGYNLRVSATSTNAYTGVYSTNTYARGFTVTNSSTYPYTSSYAATYFTNNKAFQDVSLSANIDGSNPQGSICVDIVGDNASFTNTGLFKFAIVPKLGSVSGSPGLSDLPATAAANQFSFSITGNGTTDVVVCTNLPSAALTSILQGQTKLRCTAIEWSNAGTNGYVVGLTWNQAIPVGPPQ